jgi:hypothetical protein
MSAATNNPTQVIQTLDAELDHEVSLVLYGRAALCLGFDNPPAQFAMTHGCRCHHLPQPTTHVDGG